MAFEFLQKTKTPGFLKPLAGEFLFKKEPQEIGIKETLQYFPEALKETVIQPFQQIGDFLFKDVVQKATLQVKNAYDVAKDVLVKPELEFKPVDKLFDIDVEQQRFVSAAQESLETLKTTLFQEEQELKEIPKQGIVLTSTLERIPLIADYVRKTSPRQQAVDKSQKIEDLRASIDIFEELVEEQTLGERKEGILIEFKEGITDALKQPENLIPGYRLVAQAEEYGDLFTAVGKIQRNEELNDKEQGLITKYQAQGLPVNKSVPYLVGRMLPEMPAWMIEFTFGKGLVGKPVEKAVGKVIEKQIVAKTAGALAHAVAMGLANVPIGVAEKAIPYQEELENPLMSQFFEEIGGEFEWKKAMVQAFGSGFVETLTEYAGEAVQKPLKYLARVTLGKWLSKTGIKLTEGTLAKLIKQAGWNGIVGEVFEEELNEFFQAPLAEREYKAPWTKEGAQRLLVETLGIIAFQGIVTAVDALEGKLIPGLTIKIVGEAEDGAPILSDQVVKHTLENDISRYAEMQGLTEIANKIKNVDVPRPYTVKNLREAIFGALTQAEGEKIRPMVYNRIGQIEAQLQDVAEHPGLVAPKPAKAAPAKAVVPTEAKPELTPLQEMERAEKEKEAEKPELDKLAKATTGQKIEIKSFAGIADEKDSGFRSPTKDVARAYGEIKGGELHSVEDTLENPFVTTDQNAALKYLTETYAEELGAKAEELITRLQEEVAKTGKLPPDLPLVQEIDAFVKERLQEQGYDSVIYKYDNLPTPAPEYQIFDVTKSEVVPVEAKAVAPPPEIKPTVETGKRIFDSNASTLATMPEAKMSKEDFIEAGIAYYKTTDEFSKVKEENRQWALNTTRNEMAQLYQSVQEIIGVPAKPTKPKRAVTLFGEPAAPEPVTLETIAKGKKLPTPKETLAGSVQKAEDRWATLSVNAEELKEEIAKTKEPLEKRLEELKSARDKASVAVKKDLRKQIQEINDRLNEIDSIVNEDIFDFQLELRDMIIGDAKRQGVEFKSEEEEAQFGDDVLMALFDERTRVPYWDMSVQEVIDLTVKDYKENPPTEEELGAKESAIVMGAMVSPVGPYEAIRRKAPMEIPDTPITKKLQEKLETLGAREDNAGNLLEEGDYRAYVEGWCEGCFPKDLEYDEYHLYAERATTDIARKYIPEGLEVIEAGYIEEEVGDNPYGASYVIYKVKKEPTVEIPILGTVGEEGKIKFDRSVEEAAVKPNEDPNVAKGEEPEAMTVLPDEALGTESDEMTPEELEVMRQMAESEMSAGEWDDKIDRILNGTDKMRTPSDYDRSDWKMTLEGWYFRVFKDDPNLDPPDVVADNLGMTVNEFMTAIEKRIRGREAKRIPTERPKLKFTKEGITKISSDTSQVDKAITSHKAWLKRHKQMERDQERLGRFPVNFRKRYQSIAGEQEFYKYEQDYAEARVARHRGYTERLLNRLKEVGVRQEIIDQLKVNEDYLKDLVKIKREPLTKTISAVISKESLEYLEHTSAPPDAHVGWVKRYSAEAIAKDVRNLAQGYETGRRFFRRLGEGFENLIFNPVRRGERDAAKADYWLRKKTKAVFNLTKKEAEELMIYSVNLQRPDTWKLAVSDKLGTRIMKEQLLTKPLTALSPKVQEAYKVARKYVGLLYPKVKEVTVMRGREIGQVENYLPLYTRKDIKLIDEGGVFDWTRKDPYFASIKRRIPQVPIDLYELDFRKTWDSFITGVSRYMHIGKATVPVKYFIDSNEFQKIAGKETTKKVHEWYRFLVNPPKVEGFWRGLKIARGLNATYILGLKYATTVKQFLNLIDFTVITGFSRMLSATGQVLRNSPTAQMARESGSVQERTLGYAVSDLKGTIVKWLRKPPEFTDKLTAIIGKIALMDQQMAHLKEKGVDITKLSKEQLENIEEISDNVVDAVMGGMARSETPPVFRSELGKSVNMFYSQMNAKMQFYLTDIFRKKYPKLDELSGSHKKLLARAIVAVFVSTYLETVINKLAFFDKPEEIGKDMLTSLAGNFPLLGSIVFAIETGQPYSPIPVLGNVIQLMSNIHKGNVGDSIWDLTGFVGMPKQIRKTLEGLVVATEGKVEYKGKMIFPVEGAMEKIRTIFIGKWGSMEARNYFRVSDRMEKLEKQYSDERDNVIIPLLEEGDIKGAKARAKKFNKEMEKKIGRVEEKYDVEFEINRKRLTIQDSDLERWQKDIEKGERGKPSLERRFGKKPTAEKKKTVPGGIGSSIEGIKGVSGGIGTMIKTLK